MRKLTKRLISIIISVVIVIVGAGCSNSDKGNVGSSADSPLIGSKNEEYYMVTFLSGLEYWKGCYKGFSEAGNIYGVKTVFTGALQYDVNQQITALQQVIAKKPAGIAVSCINPEALAAPIKEAIASGIPVVTFDADSPQSGRYSFLATGNEYAGSIAAQALAEQIGTDDGEVVIITLPAQQNHEERVTGFKDTIDKKYPNLKVVQIGNGKGDQTEAAKVLSGILQAHPNIKGVFCTDATSGVGAAAAVKEADKVGKVKVISFDTDKGTLDAIKSGVISATIAQGTYVMGYQSMNFLYQMKHELVNPVMDWKEKGISPLPNFVDTGVSVVTKENVESFYGK